MPKGASTGQATKLTVRDTQTLLLQSVTSAEQEYVCIELYSWAGRVGGLGRGSEVGVLFQVPESSDVSEYKQIYRWD